MIFHKIDMVRQILVQYEVPPTAGVKNALQQVCQPYHVVDTFYL